MSEELPFEVRKLCEKVGLKVDDVAEYRVGGREVHYDIAGPSYWVFPVSVLTKDGRKFAGEVVDLNTFPEVQVTWQAKGKGSRKRR